MIASMKLLRFFALGGAVISIVLLLAPSSRTEDQNPAKAKSGHAHSDASKGKGEHPAHEGEEGHAHSDEHGEEAGEHKGDHAKEEEGHAHSEGESEGHGDHHDEEAGGNVGPDKGIISYSKKEGFQLSPEAMKSFDVKFERIAVSGQFSGVLSALVTSGENRSVFRFRGGSFKRVEVQVKSKSATDMRVTTSELKEGDQVAVKGAAFLRIAEIDAEGGVGSGHSH